MVLDIVDSRALMFTVKIKVKMDNEKDRCCLLVLPR